MHVYEEVNNNINNYYYIRYILKRAAIFIYVLNCGTFERFHLIFIYFANCSIASYRFAYETVPREQSRNSQARKFPRRDGATRTSRVALTLLAECQRRRRSLRNSKTNAKIRQISRTVRRIDSSFRGRCYEMDPCTTPRARWRERKREKDR